MRKTVDYFRNPRSRLGSPNAGLFSDDEYDDVSRFFDGRPDLAPSPLRRLNVFAKEIGVAEILIKDESARFGMNAFKIVGVTYSMNRKVERGQLRAGDTVACATAGNHGRAVARVARELGMRAMIYVPAVTMRSRVEAIEKEGATVVSVEGNYDEAVVRAAEDAERSGWRIISDHSWPGYEGIPRLIMAGYTRIIAEASVQWQPGSPPDVVLVQAGVGGLACAVTSWLLHRYGEHRPLVITCEPLAAACALESARAGAPVRLAGEMRTIMSPLACGEVSHLAWPVLREAADAYVAIDDEWGESAVGAVGSELNASATGACGLGALLALKSEGRLEEIGIGPLGRVLVFNTEGGDVGG